LDKGIWVVSNQGCKCHDEMTSNSMWWTL